jgi:lambda family phage portal protein
VSNPVERIAEYFDGLVAAVDPVAGMKRKYARAMSKLVVRNSGYSAGGASSAKTSMKKWAASSGDTRTDIETNLLTLRQRSRELFMTSGIARAALNRLETNVIGSGLRLRALPDAEVLGMDREQATVWARQVEREWALWANSRDCDALGLDTFAELQQIAFLSWLQSGDVFALLPMRPLPWMANDLRVQLVEADRVSTPQDKTSEDRYHDGVEVDGNGRVIAYHFCNRHPLSITKDKNTHQQWKRIPARGPETGRPNVLHLRAAERPEQYRGVPLLAPVIEDLKQISRYKEAELMAAVISAMYTVFITSTTPQTPLGEAFVDEEEVAADVEAGVEARASSQDSANEIALGNGAVMALNADEDVKFADPTRPNASFDAFVGAAAREIGASINVPSELLLLQFTSSYSASRAALLEAWKAFRKWRSWMVNDFCQPIYAEWLIISVLTGRIAAPGIFDDAITAAAWLRAEWNGPAAGQIDPTKEVAAAVTRVENGFSTRTREAAEINGSDYEANITALADENARAEDAGVTLGTPAAAVAPMPEPNPQLDEPPVKGNAR